jgi:hypothetical protein
MTLPSPTGGPTLRQVGFFAYDHRGLAQWLVDRLGDGWRISAPAWRSRQDVLTDLTPTPQPSRDAFVPVDGWTLMLNNALGGTDVGLLPGRAAKTLRCRAIRAFCVDDGQPGYPGRILEVHSPLGTPPQAEARTIAAVNDGGPLALPERRRLRRSPMAPTRSSGEWEAFVTSTHLPRESR